jgi:hypothetical protein
MYPYATCLSKLGSRFTLFLDPPNRRVLHSALGRFLDADLDLALGVRVGRTAYAVPLTKRVGPFRFCEQHLSMTAVRYVGTAPDLGLRFTAELRSPFYPQDERLSLAPLFYVTLSVEPVTWFHWTFPRKDLPGRGEMFLEVQRAGARRVAGGDAGKGGLWFAYRVPDLPPRTFGEGPSERAIPKRGRPFGAREALVPLGRRMRTKGWRLAREFRLPLKGPVSETILWAAHVDDPAVMTVEDEPARFKYADYFKDLAAVVRFGRRGRGEIERRTRFFDSLFSEGSLSKAHQDLIAFSFQSYLSNTWWLARPRGGDWFGVWEGVCRYHSTVDVEYNAGLVYLALWPKLLEMQIRQWSRYAKDAGGGAAWMSHDVGGDLWVGRQVYDHEMEVEESANFVLMLHALWRWTGRDALLRRHVGLVRRLAEFVLRADTQGDGIPDQGVANTVDDASPAVQYARKQTYLAVKSLAALQMAAEMAHARGEDRLGLRCMRRVRKIRRTLDRRAWLGDHYAVCLERDLAGLKDAWAKRPFPAGELGGWDAYSIYTANGMLYPSLVGRNIDMDPERLRSDLAAAAAAALTPFGCTHSSHDRSNLWVSQNLWRDYCAAYLGIDMLDNVDRYWAFQTWDNTGPHAPGFVDTYGGNNLCYYPRGIVSIGVLFAALGFCLDRGRGVMGLGPVRAPLRLPLVALADWRRMRVPWCEVAIDQKCMRVTIDGRLPKGLKVVMVE